MLAAAVIAIVFTSLLVVTWLSSRADAAQNRCDQHLRHIHEQLEDPPSSTVRPPRHPRPPPPR